MPASGPASRTFSLADQLEVFFTSTVTSRAIRRLVREGHVRQIQGPLYTKNLDDPLEDVTRRRCWDVAAGFFPGAVIADRTAFEMRPSGSEGAVFLCGDSARTLDLPGLVLNCRRGPGPADGDTPFLDGRLYLSSWPRRFIDNMRPSRSRRTTRRTLTRAELEAKLRDILVRQGADGLNGIRDGAAALAGPLGAPREFDELSDLIGALLGTVDARLETAGARAAAAGRGWDDNRLALFDALAAALHAHVAAARPERRDQSGQAFSFYEAYFSNFIEGTEFTLEEAREIVFDGVIPEQRPADGHDVAGTFDLVADPQARSWVPSDAAELETILRSFHARIMVGRPEIGPGEFKLRANRAGATEFVDPSLVEGTLERAFDRYASLPPGFGRAVFALFLVAEVHPFADGNGRVARALANAELTAAGEQRLIVPTVFRDDYLHALRALSRASRPDALLRVADRAQVWTYEVDFSTLERARTDLEATNALLTPDDADVRGAILRLPSELARPA